MFRNEEAFTDAVIDLAKMYGFLVHHDRGDMRRRIQGHVGFPDVVCVNKDRLIVAELKHGKNKVTPEQRKWLDAFEWPGCCESYVWYSSDWDAILEVFARRP